MNENEVDKIRLLVSQIDELSFAPIKANFCLENNLIMYAVFLNLKIDKKWRFLRKKNSLFQSLLSCISNKKGRSYTTLRYEMGKMNSKKLLLPKSMFFETTNEEQIISSRGILDPMQIITTIFFVLLLKAKLENLLRFA